MNTSLVMTVIGLDRPGLVESVARLVAAHGGNWLESRMSRLGGHFAGILRIELPKQNESALVQALQALNAQGLTIVVHADTPPAITGPRTLRNLEVVGQDRPGIVQQISSALAARGVNVEELHTERQSAPMSGELLFKSEAIISIPESCDLAGLKKDLEKIASDLIVDFSLAEVPNKSGSRT